jgi:hypothetical protein
MNTVNSKGNNKKELSDWQFLKSYLKKGGELIIELSAQVL